MITWDDAIDICQETTGDNTSTTLASFKRDMNVGYKKILAQFARQVTEKEKTADTVADQQYYQAPSDLLWLKSIKIASGDTIYPLVEIESQDDWNWINQTTQTSSIPEYFFVKPTFGVRGTEVGIYPIPSTSGNEITMVYEASDRDLAQDAYSTGTATVTNGSATVTGSGTTWTNAMIGRYLVITDAEGDGMYYRIANRSSNTSITLENVYEGTTHSGNYKIVELFNLPEDMQMLPIYWALNVYYDGKGNKEKVAQYLGLYRSGIAEGKRIYGTKSRGNVIRRIKYSRWSSYPRHFPESVS